MSIIRRAVLVAALSAVTLSCGDADEPASAPEIEATEAIEVDPTVVSTAPASQKTPTVAATEPAAGVATPAVAEPRAQAEQLEQPAIWPAAEVVFDTPEEAAGDFVSSVFGVAPALGEYRGGDQRSGEIDVLVDNVELTEPQVRSGLAVRKLAPTDGWFVLGARNDAVSITVPEASVPVGIGPLTVEGLGRGFEGTVVVSAFTPGAADAPIDEVIVAGGPFEQPEPYSTQLDLSSAQPGVVVILARGDTGLDGDTGEFSAIPVVVTDALPPLR